MSISKVSTPQVTTPIPPSTESTGVSTQPTSAPTDPYIANSGAVATSSNSLEFEAPFASRAIGSVITNGALSNEVRAHLLAAQSVLDGVACGCFDPYAARCAADQLCTDLKNGAFTSSADRQAVANAINVLERASMSVAVTPRPPVDPAPPVDGYGPIIDGAPIPEPSVIRSVTTYGD